MEEPQPQPHFFTGCVMRYAAGVTYDLWPMALDHRPLIIGHWPIPLPDNDLPPNQAIGFSPMAQFRARGNARMAKPKGARSAPGGTRVTALHGLKCPNPCESAPNPHEFIPGSLPDDLTHNPGCRPRLGRLVTDQPRPARPVSCPLAGRSAPGRPGTSVCRQNVLVRPGTRSRRGRRFQRL